MNTSLLSSRQSHRLTQVGMFLFFLGLITGLLVPVFAIPRLGLSAHLLAILQGIFLVVLGLLWPRLKLGNKASQLVFWLSIYGCFAAWSANILGGVLGAGNTLLPIAAGQAHGSPVQETLIALLLRSAAVSLITSVILILWGLHRASGNQRTDA